MVRQVESNRRMQGMVYYDGIAAYHQLANVFTAEEILCFMFRESLIRDTETVGEDYTRITDRTVEHLAQTAGFTKVDVLERMVQSAFDSFAPGLPLIPNERVLKVLEFRKVQKLGKAYGLASSLPWVTLKEELILRRSEILSVYKKVLVTDVDVRLEHSTAQKRSTYLGSSSAVKRQRTQDGKGPVFPAARPACSSQPKIAGPSRTSSCTLLIPVYHLPSCSNPRVSGPKEQQLPRVSDDTRSTANLRIVDTTVVHSSYPTPPEDNRDFSHPPRPSVVPRGNIVNEAKVPSFVNVRRRRPGMSHEAAVTHDDHPLNHSKTRPRDNNPAAKEQHCPGAPRAQPSQSKTTGKRSHISKSLSMRTDIYSLLQLASSPEHQEEDPEDCYDDIDDWSDDDESLANHPDAVGCSILTGSTRISGSSPSESPFTITMRKLEELWQQAIKEKQTRGTAQQQPYDLMTSPDSLYAIDEAYHSPRETRRNCLFTFRGYRVEVPATAARACRRRAPVWHVREDPGSPTPSRTTIPLPEPDIFDFGETTAAESKMSPALVPTNEACEGESMASILPAVTSFITPHARPRVFFKSK